MPLAAAGDAEGQGDFQDQDDEEIANEKPSNSGASNQVWMMPDARLLNKLFVWLVSTSVVNVKEEGEQSEQPYGSNEDPQALQQQQQLNSTAANQGGKRGEDESGFPVDSELLEKVDRIYESDPLLSNLNEILDIESMNLIYKVNVQAIKRCENLLLIPSNAAPAELPQYSADDSERMVSEKDAMEIASPDNRNGHAEQSKESRAAHPVFSDEDSIRLSAVMITFGAPLHPAKSGNLPLCLLECLGITVNSDNQEQEVESSGVIRRFDWQDIISFAGVNQSVDLVMSFYETIWLPFCSSITGKKVLSHSQNKLLIPNPLETITEHSFASRGLCHVFLLRQKIRLSSHFLLQHALSRLLDYLKSPYGRSVEHMPVWWCPWVHDLGALLAIVKYGYFNQLTVPLILEDPQLPFNKQYLDHFVRNVFLRDGSDGIVPVGSEGKLANESAELFVQIVLSQFPDYREIEVRVMRILEDMSRLLSLPSSSPVAFSSFRVLCSVKNGDENVAQQATHQSQQLNSSAGGDGGSRVLDLGLRHAITPSLLPKFISTKSLTESSLVQQANSNGVAMYPAVPLEHFLKRKRLASEKKSKKRKRIVLNISHK